MEPAQATDFRERPQSGYFKTSVRTRDGQRFTEGDAELTVVNLPAKTEVTLQIHAVGAHDEKWSARFRLPEAALLSAERTHLDFSKTVSDGVYLARARGRKSTVETDSARLDFQVELGTERRSLISGQVEAGDDLSAEFRTELTVNCLVPEAELGIEPNGTIESDDSTAVQLAIDSRFESAACRQFLPLL